MSEHDDRLSDEIVRRCATKISFSDDNSYRLTLACREILLLREQASKEAHELLDLRAEVERLRKERRIDDEHERSLQARITALCAQLSASPDSAVAAADVALVAAVDAVLGSAVTLLGNESFLTITRKAFDDLTATRGPRFVSRAARARRPVAGDGKPVDERGECYKARGSVETDEALAEAVVSFANYVNGPGRTAFNAMVELQQRRWTERTEQATATFKAKLGMSNPPSDTSAAGRGGGEAECLRLFQNALLRAHDTKEERQHQYKSFLVALERISSPPAACDSKPHEAAVKLAEAFGKLWDGAEILPHKAGGALGPLWHDYRAARAAGGEGERRDEAERVFGAPRNARGSLKDALGAMLVAANEGENGMAPLRFLEDVLSRLDDYVMHRIDSALSARQEPK